MTRSRRRASRRSAFEPDEPPHLRLRSELMAVAMKLIEDRKLTQLGSAIVFGVTQPRVSNLVRGKAELFTIDALVGMLARAGVHIEMKIIHLQRRKANSPARRTPSPPPAP